MITAEEAFKLSRTHLEDEEQVQSQTIDALLEVEKTIQEAIRRGHFVCATVPLPYKVAERLAIDLEEFGYNTSTQHSGRFDTEGNPLPYVLVNWRYKPDLRSRVEQPASYG